MTSNKSRYFRNARLRTTCQHAQSGLPTEGAYAHSRATMHAAGGLRSLCGKSRSMSAFSRHVQLRTCTGGWNPRNPRNPICSCFLGHTDENNS